MSYAWRCLGAPWQGSQPVLPHRRSFSTCLGEAGSTLLPLSLLGSVSLIVSGSAGGTVSVGSKVSQASISVEAASAATRDVPRDRGGSGVPSLASAPESDPAAGHISTVPLPAPFRNSIRGTPHAPGPGLCRGIPSLSFLTSSPGQGPFQYMLGTQPPCHRAALSQAMGELGVGRMSGGAIAAASHCPERASAQEGPQQGLEPDLTSLASVTGKASRDSTRRQLGPQGRRGQPGKSGGGKALLP